MNADLERDDPLFRQLDLAPIGAHPRSWHTQNSRKGTLSARYAEHAVDPAGTARHDPDILQTHKENLHFGRGEVGLQSEPGVDGQRSQLGFLRRPERVKVGGIHLGGDDLFRGKTGGGQSPVGFSVERRRHRTPQEPRLVHRAPVDD